MDITEIARQIRQVEYVIITLVVLVRAAHNWASEAYLVSLIHLFLALTLLSFFNSITFKFSWVTLWVSTPLLTALTIASVVYAVKRFR